MNADDEAESARDRIALGCKGDHGVGDQPTIFSKPDDEANGNCASIVIRKNKCCKNGQQSNEAELDYYVSLKITRIFWWVRCLGSNVSE
jgi:hypothetical protein